ncbi:MAG: hypothetical protein Q3M30_08100 [Candidatus Electrothrix sp. Rat3]|nr:hypothetical protein [Candidatus Electrothrix rattekaaiensis]
MQTTGSVEQQSKINTLEKIRRLEAYIAADNTTADAVLDSSLTKLLAREQVRVHRLAERLRQGLQQFESSYKLLSEEFYIRYCRGDMGDEMDFIEWASTVEMLADAEKRLNLLNSEQ